MNMSMLEKLIIYFACKTKGYITKTQLVKFLYLADLAAVKWTEKQLTDLDWRYYKHGPWNEEIDRTLDQLCADNVLETVKRGQATFVQPAANCPELNSFRLTKGLELMLDNIRHEWAGASKVDSLLEYVYSTKPMVEAQANHDWTEQAPLNLRLEHEKVCEELGV